MFLCVWAAPRGNTSRLQIAYLRVTQWQASWVQPQLTWDDVGRHLPSLPTLLCAQDLLFREGLGKAHRCPRTWLAVPVRIRGLSLYKVERCLCVPLPLLIEEKGEFGNELRARSTTCCFLKWDLKQLTASLTQVHKLLREPDTLAHLPTPPTRAQWNQGENKWENATNLGSGSHRMVTQQVSAENKAGKHCVISVQCRNNNSKLNFQLSNFCHQDKRNHLNQRGKLL